MCLAIFAADASMNSTDNLEELDRACGNCLLATRMASISEIKHEVLGKRDRHKVIRDKLHAKEQAGAKKKGLDKAP